jgi:hypothetical protein
MKHRTAAAAAGYQVNQTLDENPFKFGWGKWEEQKNQI